MSDIVIHAENLGKKYTIGHESEDGRYVTLRDVLTRNARGLWRKTKDLVHGKPIILGDTLEEVWALRDVSFEIRRGEAVGIIGRNGAGKSTLLKILSRITEPSAGRVTVKGRVASLLEVGTGFHPELTGRENIYLNGAILGMARAEIKRKFDEIVAFAEVERYLDTPVKRYSSGMYVRLAFAVAAHLEPEILVVDEVLAVGDAQFQKKCLGKMGEIEGEGRTIVFVSHDMTAIRALCGKTMLLVSARVAAIGDATAIVSQYLIDKEVAGGGEVNLDPPTGAEIAFTRIWVTDAGGAISSRLDVKEPFTIWLDFVARRRLETAEISVCLTNTVGVNVLFTSLSDGHNGETVALAEGRHVASVRVNGSFLMPQDYLLRVSAHYRGVRDIDLHENILKVTIVETGSTMAPYGRAAKHWSCVLGGTTWRLDGDRSLATAEGRNE